MTLRRFAFTAVLAMGASPALAQDAIPPAAPAQTAPDPNAQPTSQTPAEPSALGPAPGTAAAEPPDTTADTQAEAPADVSVPIAAPTQAPISEDNDAPDVVTVGGPSRIVALSPQDEAAYRAAFNAIEHGNWAGVTAALNHVQDDSLVATVRGRMLATRGYRTSFSALNSWLMRYDNLGVAPAVYQRALAARPMAGRRRHRHPVGPPPHQPASMARRSLPGTPPEIPGDSPSARAEIERIAQAVGAGDDATAKAIGADALQGPRSGQAAWELGLVAYRAHDYTEAVRQFETSAQWPYHGGWAVAAVNYWAARAHLAAGDHQTVRLHLETAAARPWTFYGQLAEDQLGRDSSLLFTPPQVDTDTLRHFVERHPAARRAAALAQLGRLSEVEAELRRLHGELSADDNATFLSLAIALRAPAAQLRAAEFGGPAEAAGFCPATSFAPDNGFTLDRALIFAIVRQESYYNPKAVSVTNARGLMQLLASTAHDMDRSTNYRRNPTSLFDPGHNLELGQNYVQWLIGWLPSGQDLGQLFASYNGGPGWLSRWVATQSDASDPLMIIETMPRADSRDYAERVLSHMTLCRKTLGQPTPELDHLAAGQPATYTPLDRRVAGGTASANGSPSP